MNGLFFPTASLAMAVWLAAIGIGPPEERVKNSATKTQSPWATEVTKTTKSEIRGDPCDPVAILRGVVASEGGGPCDPRAQSGAPGEQTAATSASATHGDYVGSEGCRACHERAYAAWRQSLHSQMTRPIAEAQVSGRFATDSSLVSHGRTYTMRAADGRHSMSIARPDGTSETFAIDYTLGAKRFQGYLSRLEDGRMYVLPAFWNVAWQRWLDWSELAPVPDSSHDLRQIWNINCFNCHATNIQRNFDAGTRTFATTASEFGIGCEGCHGPGRAHAEAAETWKAQRGGPRAFGDIKIFSSRTATTQQAYDLCAYCHGNKTNSFTGYAPGSRLEDFAQLSLMSDPVPSTDPQGDFWPDGRPSRFNRPQALTLSGCFQSGQLTCTACHVAHGSANEHSLKVPVSESDSLCTQCHLPLREPAALSRHSRHAPDSAGSRCVQCHMSDVNWRLLMRRRDHTFSPPVPELTARLGIPNACTTCHEDRAPEWAADVMDEWYGDRPRRRTAVDVAETMYAAGSGRHEVIDRLGALAVDRRQGALIRASAAGFVERLASPATPVPESVVAALVEASADPEAMVRVAAVRALGTARADAAIGALAARLTDPARVVRISAAEALLYLGVTTGLGSALAQAQDEYAESLRTFPDMASSHTSLGWLLAAQGRTGEARQALRTAQALDPADPRPRVYLGVLAAREGRYAEAIQEWKDARRLDPAYPNIDRLIAEAERRR